MLQRASNTPGAMLVLLMLLSVNEVALAQVPPGGAPAEVTRAQAALSAGLVDSAVVTLEDFFRRNPTAVTGRLVLGMRRCPRAVPRPK